MVKDQRHLLSTTKLGALSIGLNTTNSCSRYKEECSVRKEMPKTRSNDGIFVSFFL